MKKKGLIISTIVMVVVLVASLSTATFAWFSSQAEATIENINVTTVAAEGLQVAVKEPNDSVNAPNGYVSGNITYTGGKFGGDVDNWGSLANFGDITSATDGLGQMDKATTVAETGKYYIVATIVKGGTDADPTYTATNFTTKYKGLPLYKPANVANPTLDAAKISISGANATKLTSSDNANVQSDGSLNSDLDSDYSALITALGTAGVTVLFAEFPAGTMLLPIDHDPTTNLPTAFEVASANKNYLDLPLSVRSTVTSKAILCTITVIPEQNKMAKSDYMPGMAAASRVEISTFSDATKVNLFNPFDEYKTTASGLVKTDDSPWAAGEIYTLKFAIAYTTTATLIDAFNAYDLKYKIWIEGTDGQCINETSGSKFNIGVSFAYINGTSAATVTEDSVDAPSKITVANATDSALNGDWQIVKSTTKVTAAPAP